MIIKLYKNGENDAGQLQRIVDVLADGGTIIYPTDTTYAIGCHALKERAVEYVCRLKGIDPKKNNLSIICYDLSTISQYARMDNATFKLMKRNLPGPFTFILEAESTLPRIFRNRKQVGIRMPDSSIIMQIAKMLEAPILTASLPVVSEDEPEYQTDPELIAERYESKVDLLIDAGIGELYQSTVVDCTGDEPEVVRQGLGELQ